MSADFGPRDFDLLKRCLTERWSSTEERRRAVLDHMFRIAMDASDPKTAVKAAKFLLDAEGQDLEGLKVAVGAAAVKVLAGQGLGATSTLVSDEDLREGLTRLVGPREEVPRPEGVVRVEARAEVA